MRIFEDKKLQSYY